MRILVVLVLPIMANTEALYLVPVEHHFTCFQPIHTLTGDSVVILLNKDKVRGIQSQAIAQTDRVQ